MRMLILRIIYLYECVMAKKENDLEHYVEFLKKTVTPEYRNHLISFLGERFGKGFADRVVAHATKAASSKAASSKKAPLKMKTPDSGSAPGF